MTTATTATTTSRVQLAVWPTGAAEKAKAARTRRMRGQDLRWCHWRALEEQPEAGHLSAGGSPFPSNPPPPRRGMHHRVSWLGASVYVPGSVCVHFGFLLFPRLPFRSLARQPVSGVSAKTSTLPPCVVVVWPASKDISQRGPSNKI